jgi:hypothetical protein
MEILVFKTNACECQLSEINKYLGNITGIDSWNFDLEDVDRILRVKAVHMHGKEIEQVLQKAGYECVELPD